MLQKLRTMLLSSALTITYYAFMKIPIIPENYATNFSQSYKCIASCNGPLNAQIAFFFASLFNA